MGITGANVSPALGIRECMSPYEENDLDSSDDGRAAEHALHQEGAHRNGDLFCVGAMEITVVKPEGKYGCHSAKQKSKTPRVKVVGASSRARTDGVLLPLGPSRRRARSRRRRPETTTRRRESVSRGMVLPPPASATSSAGSSVRRRRRLMADSSTRARRRREREVLPMPPRTRRARTAARRTYL